MKREFYFVCTSLFLIVFGTFLAAQVFVPLTTSLGGTSFTIGIISGSMYAVRLIFGSPIGRLSQKRGPKRILKYSLILYPFIAIAYYLSWNIPSLIAARLLHGLASAMMLPVAMAYIGEISPSGQEGRYMGIYNTIYYIASASGPVVGGLIYDSYGTRPAFLVLFILSVLSLTIILIVPGNTRCKAYNNPSVTEQRDIPTRKLLIDKRLLALTVITVVSAILMTLLGLWFQQLLLLRNLKMSLIGFLVALFSLIIGIMQVPFGRFADKCNQLKLFLLSGILSAVFVIALPLVDNLWFTMVLIVILSLFVSLNLAVSSAFSAIYGKEAGMSNTMGFLGSANSAGIIVGSLTLGGLTDWLGINITFTITGIIFLIGVILFCMLWIDKKHEISI